MKNISCLLSFIFIFMSCSGKAQSDNASDRINSGNIIRFDEKLLNYLQTPSVSNKESLEAYKGLLSAVGTSTINQPLADDTVAFYASLSGYFSHPMLMNIYKDASLKTFANIGEYESQLNNIKGRVKEYMPGAKLPDMAIHVSGFKENTIVIEGLISLSIDKYLGENYPAYQNYFEPYQRYQMQPKFILRDYLKAWLLSEFRKKENSPTLLSNIVEEGKTLYILSVLLPDTKTEDIIGYTEAQLSWCKNNESMVWKSMIKNNHLYSNDFSIISKYITERAHTNTVSPDSPGRVGSWIGWQIVSEYVAKTDSSIKDMLTTPSQTILKAAKYNPK